MSRKPSAFQIFRDRINPDGRTGTAICPCCSAVLILEGEIVPARQVEGVKIEQHLAGTVREAHVRQETNNRAGSDSKCGSLKLPRRACQQGELLPARPEFEFDDPLP